MASEISVGALTNSCSAPKGWAARFVTAFLNRLEAGSLVVQTPDGRMIERQTDQAGPHAVLSIHHWRAIRRLLLGGDLGFAEAYLDGDWSSPDVTALIQLGALNADSAPVDYRGAWVVRLFHRLVHLARPNSREGSRRNIQDHYDLGNAFYALWLDPGMTYSSGLYRSSEDRLEAAQDAKLARVIELLDVAPGHEVLEIGCGWGALAERLISLHGNRVTGLTLSPSQLEVARKRIEDSGLDDKAAFKLLDYRDVSGKFDRIVSIEMLEAVGEAYWPTYFKKLRDSLTEGGKAVLQVITISDKYFDEYRRSADFIQRYVFPGGMLPSPSVLREQIAQAGLRLSHYETFGRSYALTLAAWRERFHGAWPEISALGYSDRFKRIWDYYLSYCEAGFLTGRIDVCLCSVEINPGS